MDDETLVDLVNIALSMNTTKDQNQKSKFDSLKRLLYIKYPNSKIKLNMLLNKLKHLSIRK